LTHKKICLDQEIKIILHMITNDRFIKEIYPIIKPAYFKTGYSRLVSSWCIEYYEKFSIAPKKDITDIYKMKRAILQDEDENDVDTIKLFLSNLSAEWEKYSEINNIDFVIQESIKYLNVRSLEILKDQIEESLLDNAPETGQHFIANYKRVERMGGEGIDILKDTGKIINAFTAETDTLITFSGDVGKVIQPISRGDFVSFFGPAARGKSHWLWLTSEEALKHGCKVLHITLEMTENEMIRRAWPSLTGHPKTTQEVKWATFEQNDEGLYEIIQHEREKKGIDLENILAFQKKLKRLFRKGNVKILRPLEPINVSWLEVTCDNLYHYDNFVPDVIVIDYADYMVPDKGFKNVEGRERLNNIWVGLRQFAIRKNIAIITASHTAKVTFESDIKTSHASEDIRKINNVTMAIGLNQTKKEQEMNIMRLGLMEIREGRAVHEQVVVTQCLDVGRPCLNSKMKSQVVSYNNEEENKEETKRKYTKRPKNLE